MTTAIAASALESETLARRLRELAGEERNVQVDFLLHLDEFDRRRAFLDAGYDSLWTYCLRELHLREGPAARRIAAMKVLRRFPALEGPLRDGRLCLSTVTLLGPLLTQENLSDLVARAAFGTKAEVEHLVVSLQPRSAPKEGIRKLPDLTAPTGTLAPAVAKLVSPEVAPHEIAASLTPANSPMLNMSAPARPDAAAVTAAVPEPVETPRRAEMRPVSKDEWSLRVTIDANLKADLETLTNLLSHKSRGDLAAVLREAIRCGIEKHGKRKGAVKPTRERPQVASAKRNPNPRAIPAALRRQVWERDGGCCTWVGKDGRRCGSRWKVEIDHIDPVALGGVPTLDKLRLLCRAHNKHYAEQVFGREHMARFGRKSTHPGMSAGTKGQAPEPGGPQARNKRAS